MRDMENRDRPTSIDYTFRIADYFQKIGDEIYINLNLNKDYYNDFINTTIRHTPVENEYRYVKEEIAVLDIPEGYTIDYMPPDVKHEGTLMGITVDYETVDKQIVMKKTFYVDYLLMNPSQFSEWNEAIARASEAYKESIILKKN